MSFRLVAINIIFLVTFASGFSIAQQPASSKSDTLRLTVDTAEKLFLKNNLALIGQKFQIEADRAQIIQAKLFQNPNFYFESSVPTSLNGNFYDPTMHSENSVQVQQLFYLAGKRKKRAEVEKINTNISEYEYYNILRQLRNELYVSFYQLNYQIQSLKIYNRQLVSAKQIADAMDEQYKKGNISLKEVTRIKALVFSLESAKLDVLSDVYDKENSLRILTRTPAQSFVLPVADENKIESFSTNNFSLQQLLVTSDTARYDLKESEFAVKREEAKLSLEKANAVPDVSVGGVYDRAGSFVQNYTGAGVSVPLPVWNRNQGNIKTEKNLVELRKTELEEKKNEVHNEVTSAFAKANEADKLYKSFDKSFASDYDKLITGITMEYQKRNISLLEFLDHYETYTESMSQITHLRNLRIEALEGINLTTGTIVIK